MNPFYFGDAAHALYGVHHPPRGSTPRASGVVLCYPFAQEYMRAHRAFRQLSNLLSGEGFHVLRFDYSGTGDSMGEPKDASVSQWDEDLGVAIQELQDMTGVDGVWLVGLRLGAALALRSATRPSVRGLVLWDPVLSGKSELKRARETRLEDGARVLEFSGVPVYNQLRDELVALDSTEASVPRGLPCLVAVSDDRPDYRALSDRLSGQGAEMTYSHVPSDGRWSEFDNWGSALIPQALIRVIVNFLSQQER